MDRRSASIALALAPFAVASRTSAQVPRTARVAWISIERASPDSPFFTTFKRSLRDAGWVEGRNLVLDAWWSGGVGEAIDRTIAEAVARRPDVIVAAGGLVVRPMMNLKVAQPVVFVYSGDPVLGGVVESFARPGGMRTGISLFSLELVPKRIELVKQLLPGMKRLAIVGWPSHAGEPREREVAIATAGKLGLDHDFFAVSTKAELDAAFDGIVRARSDAILAFSDGITIGFADEFAAFARRRRVPAVAGWAIFAEKGNLLTYGPVLQDCYARLAAYVDKILKGAKPGTLAVEFPVTQELVVNRKAATDLGIQMPASLLARADRILD